ncbi:triose-phosphate isomerase [Candidatus Woesearchaeota archaeon]|nr:triose-phosphate isomerase [Candidatus Woesearchaeota archaeon]
MVSTINTLIINFKTYEQATGENAVALAKLAEKVANEVGVEIIVAVQAADLFRVSSAVSIPVFVQHMDAVNYDSNTGWILPEDVKQNGGSGALINHSEHRLNVDVIEKTVNRAKELGLRTCVCANDADVGAALAAFKPEFVAVEPPELIGGDISVSTADPGLVKESVSKIYDVNKEEKVLVGAGVKTKDDVLKCVELGAQGVLVASGITKSQNPEQAIRDLAEGLK